MRYNAEWMIAFVTGIFHAHDPLRVSQYGHDEYSSYAKEFVNKFNDAGEYTIRDVENWFEEKYPDYGWEDLYDLCDSLANLIN